MGDKKRILQVVATDVPRDTLKELLIKARRGRGSAPLLTQERKGFYYIELDHDGFMQTVEQNLRAMGVCFNEVKEVPGGGTFRRQPAQPPLRRLSFEDLVDALLGPPEPRRKPFGG